MLTVGRWSKLLLSSAEGWEWRFQSKTVKSWEKMHFIQAEIPALSGLHKTQKTYLLSPHKYRLERYPPQGPNLNRDEGCVKDIQEWAAAVICSWSRSCDCHLPLSPTTTSLSFLIPASSKLWGRHIYGHTGLGLTQEKAPTFIRWLQVTTWSLHDFTTSGPAPALGTMSITTICPSLVYTAHSSRVLLLYLPWGQKGSSGYLRDVES